MIRKVATVLAVSIFILTACFNHPHPSDQQASNENPKQTSVALPFAKYSEPVTISLGYTVDPSMRSVQGNTLGNNPWRTAMKEKLNIELKIAWMVSKENFDQKIDLAIASNDLPDAEIVGREQLNQMVKAGELEDLTEVYNTFASPEIKKIIDSTKGLAMDQVTFNGKMMAVPSVATEDFSMLWIRQDWLDKLGLAPPRSISELEQVAKAFVEQDPDANGKADTIGLAANTGLYNDFNGGSFAFDLTPLFSAFGAYPGYWLKGADGMPVYGSTLPETKNALALLSDMYAKGLIDPQLGTRKAAEEVVVNGKAGMFFEGFYGGYWPLPSAWENDPRANWQAYALPLDADGKYNIKVSNPSDSFLVVRKGYAHPEAAIKMNNLYFRDEPEYGNEFMLIRNFFAPVDEAAYEAEAVQQILAGSKQPEDFMDRPEYKLLRNSVLSIKKAKLEPYTKLDIQYWNQGDESFMRAYSLLVGGRNFSDPNLNRIESLTYTRSVTAEKAWRTLSKMENEAFLKIILGSASIESFDQFVQMWKEQGGEKITNEVAQSLQ
ncbi:extracellular solute-binding protein [Paenibacillus sabinae]|uniref:Sugar ABC transporter periplasmic protein n=1 Tax=Paenibacillus sabinae T27 TaxID=1268072 RepID=X4ZFP8_9BACL|nr:extracellular solute-binding protein [Paenibacillus sabinae]AHV98326.1 sugar ABC transporter periplasmic protein [Paenibacillus sabinae T27]